MDALTKALTRYDRLLNKDFYITIAKNEDKRILHLVFKKANFPHLLGITKLKDLAKINGAKPAALYNKIKRGEITWEYLTKSNIFADIEERIHDFARVEQIIQNLRNRKIIIQFNPKRAGTLIEADYLMYSQEGLEYLYLFLVKELGRDAQDNQYVPMSFFCTTNYRYLQNQTVYNVLDVKTTPFQKRPKNKK